MSGCDVVSPVDCEQHFFLHVFGIGGVVLPAGQMAEVRPHGRADRLQRFDCIAVFVDDRLHRQYFDFLVFQLHQIAPVNSL